MNKNIYQLINEHAKNTPDKTACIYNNNHVSYHQLINIVDNLACGLYGIGLRSENCMAVFCANNLEFVYLDFSHF